MPGRVGRWLTEQFNDWPEGSREAAERRGRDRAAAPVEPPGRSRGRRDAVVTARAPVRIRRSGHPLWHTSRASNEDAGGTVGATGLSSDPKEYRARLGRAGRRPDRRLGRRAAARRRDPAWHRQGRRRLPARRPDSMRPVSNGCSLPAAGRRRPSDATGPATSSCRRSTLHALVPGLRSQVADARDRLIAYLVANFGETVFV